MAFSWKLYGDGKTPPLGEAVAPDERLSWPRTVGHRRAARRRHVRRDLRLPAGHGPGPQPRDHDERDRDDPLPAHRAGEGPQLPGHAAPRSSVASSPSARRAVTRATSSGAILIAGVVLALVGLLIHFAGVRVVQRGAAPGRHRRGRHADRVQPGARWRPSIYWPQDQWVALADDDLRHRRLAAAARLLARISILLGLIFGYLLSWLLDVTAGQITSVARRRDGGRRRTTGSTSTGVGDADWFGLPDFTAPSFSLELRLLVLPAVIALVAENAGHVKAVAEMTKRDLDPVIGRAVFADGVGTAIAIVGRRLADHHVRREHRRHGRHPGLLDGGLLRRRDRGDPARPGARSSAR